MGTRGDGKGTVQTDSLINHTLSHGYEAIVTSMEQEWHNEEVEYSGETQQQ